MPEAEIGEGGRCGRSLRKMLPGIEGAGFDHALDGEFPAQASPKPAWRGMRAQATEQISDRLGIAGHAKERRDARAVDRGKEILQVHAQDNALAGVRCGEGLDGARLYESMRCRMCGDLLEDARENLLLDMLEAALGSFDEADVAGIFREDAVVVVRERTVDVRRLAGAETFAIGEPFQFIRSDFEPRGERADGFEYRNLPVCGRRSGLHRRRLAEPRGDVNLAAVSVKSVSQAVVGVQEANDVFAARA